MEPTKCGKEYSLFEKFILTSRALETFLSGFLTNVDLTMLSGTCTSLRNAIKRKPNGKRIPSWQVAVENKHYCLSWVLLKQINQRPNLIPKNLLGIASNPQEEQAQLNILNSYKIQIPNDFAYTSNLVESGNIKLLNYVLENEMFRSVFSAISEAVGKYKQIQMVEILKSKGVFYPHKFLIGVHMNNDFEWIKKCHLEHHVEESRLTILYSISSELGNVDFFQWMIETSQLDKSSEPLRGAARYGHFNLVKLLIDFGIHTDIWTLRSACMITKTEIPDNANRIRVFNLVLDSIPAIIVDSILICESAKIGHLEIVKRLVAKLPNDHHVWTPILEAALKGDQLNIMQWWIEERGIETFLNLVDVQFCGRLVSYNSTKIFKWLRSLYNSNLKFDPRKINYTRLVEISSKDKDYEILDYLLELPDFEFNQESFLKILDQNDLQSIKKYWQKLKPIENTNIKIEGPCDMTYLTSLISVISLEVLQFILSENMLCGFEKNFILASAYQGRWDLHDWGLKNGYSHNFEDNFDWPVASGINKRKRNYDSALEDGRLKL